MKDGGVVQSKANRSRGNDGITPNLRSDSKGLRTRSSSDVQEQEKMDILAQEERELSLPLLVHSLQAPRTMATHLVEGGSLLNLLS